MNEQLISRRFPRASAYHPEWVLAGVSGAANPLWLAEWLSESLDLRPGMRVLDLGCGGHLRRFPSPRVRRAGLATTSGSMSRRTSTASGCRGRERRIPIHADARSLPFAPEFFDAVVSIDSFPHYGTDDLYSTTWRVLSKPGGTVGMAGPG